MMAEISGGVFLALDNDVHMVAVLHDLVGNHLHLAVDFVVVAAHEALDGENGLLGVGDGLALGDLADETLAGFGECDDGGSGARTFLSQ